MAAPLRILLLNQRDPAHPAAGGAEVHLREVFGRLAAQGHEVTLLASSFPGAAPYELRDGLRIRRLAPAPFSYLATARACARLTHRGECDVVVECLNKLPFYSPTYSRAPVVALCHHLFGATAFRQLAWPVAAGVWLAERPLALVYRRHPFIAISESSREDLSRRGVPAGSVRVIPCGSHEPRCPVEVERPRPPRIAYLGRLEPYKRVDLLLRAMAPLLEAMPAAELHVVGTGSARRRLERLARRLGIDRRVVFHGFLPEEERDLLLASTRVAVCPSSKEGWGLTVLECNALGVPVVASDVAGLRDSVRHRETGLLVRFGDVEGLAGRLLEVITDDALFLRLSRASRQWSRSFDWDEAARETAAVLEAAGRRDSARKPADRRGSA